MKKIVQPSADEITQFFITEKHTKEESAEHFHVSPMTFVRWLRKLGIRKTTEQERETFLAKYPEGSEAKADILRKREQTCLQKYGASNAAQVAATKEKIRTTCIERYGVPNALQSAEIQEKVRATCLERYGVENLFQDKERQQAFHASSRAALRQHFEHLDIWEDDTRFLCWLQSQAEPPTIRDLMEFFHASDVAVGSHVHKINAESLVCFAPARSRFEDEIVAILQQWGVNSIELNNTTILDGKEIDIYLPTFAIGIEFNGNYWHSDIYRTDHGGRSRYHQEKTLCAERAGVTLFHIFEYEWQNSRTRSNILNRLKTMLGLQVTRIAARKCTIAEISKAAKKRFLDANHIQGNDHASICLGLFFQNEMVACMTFVHPKSDKYTWELSRFCTRHDCIVQGGASKLFKHFVGRLRSGETIVSYNDLTKTTGKLYNILGFQMISINAPNYVWMNFTTGDIRTRYQEQAAGEVERMHNAGYHRICDCGTKTWVYTQK